ncbi:hypothetical protein Patl1_27714 [Pistacia atlantica]|uniref:Uncharacterized protein n=1 Tax=Pistacia atlantica TaxID=434234 RepID=A0ACC1BDA9_9ROSI|nr:hypothetical protein Patl1_27714 [Pistacia atlantica]
MPLKTMLLSLLALSCLMAYATASRDLPIKPGYNLAARLEAAAAASSSGSLAECVNALWELKSCTNEIAIFFLSGQASIGPECCRAIGVITRNCWPANAMLTSLGYTAEEGDILKGYCDAEPSSPGSGIAPSPFAAASPVSN